MCRVEVVLQFFNVAHVSQYFVHNLIVDGIRCANYHKQKAAQEVNAAVSRKKMVKIVKITLDNSYY